MKKPYDRIETKIIHAGEPENRVLGAVCPPIFQTAMFEYEGGSAYKDLKYIRLNNSPNHQVLHGKLAALENAEAGLVFASGMAAISTTMLAHLRPGDHILAQDCLYGGTYDFITKDLAELGIGHDFVSADRPETWSGRVKPETKLFYSESLTNPLLQLIDHRQVTAFAGRHGLLSVIDNTFATPLNFRPIDWGYDLVVHSCTKYLNGHSDLVAGAVVGRADLVEQVLLKLNHLGGSLDPHTCFLLHRGIKTLAVRVRYQNESTQTLARFLAGHPMVSRVNYPGLESHPDHQLARELMSGFGGVLSFELEGGAEAAELFIKSTHIPVETFSLGGVETLLIQPAKTSHSGMSAQERRQAGISDGLIRLSVGLEATEELIDDFSQALDRVGSLSRA